MKKLKSTLIVLVLVCLAGTNWLFAQSNSNEYLGLPGDNLNLYAVMDVFQNSETIEAFERNLNDPDKLINNLDLNGDNLVDYIMVYDYVEDYSHTIVLRVALNKREQQDVAVFTVQQFNDGSVQIQLIGDEALYGPNYIVEPIYAETPNPGYTGNAYQAQGNNVVTTTYYEVANWPVIIYLYEPIYSPWSSMWYWGYYPPYWHPWSPHYWHFYYGYHSHWHGHYYAHYRPWRYYRSNRYRNVYITRIRNYSPTVVVNINSGRYRDTYSKPERVRDGENLFVQKHPNGVPRPTRQRLENNSIERERPNSNQGADAIERRPVMEREIDRNGSLTRPTPVLKKPRETQGVIRDDIGGSRDKGEAQEIKNLPPKRKTIAKPASRPQSGTVAKPTKKPQKPARKESARPKRDKVSKPASTTRQSGSKQEKKGTRERTEKRKRTL